MRHPVLTFCLLCCLVFPFLAEAHKLKSAFTIVLFNERTGNLEVMHRFTLHDAEEAAWTLFDKGADIIAKDSTQRQFAQYVEGQFSITRLNGQPIQLKLVGYQNDEGYFWVYQEIKQPDNVKGLKIQQNALREVWAEQINVVNIEGKGEVRSLSFSDSDTWRSVRFAP